MLINKIAFLDIESDGIWGTPKEAGIVLFNYSENRKSDAQIDFLGDKNYFDNQIVSRISDCDMIVVWHPWTKNYIAKFLNNTNKILNEKFYMEFATTYSILKNNDKHISTISHLTERILDKKHKGLALEDAKDLFNCYLKLLEI